ncbi:MAG: hypothetical protein IJ867_02370, partial [Clostridia bacterium]|nr:hypothetical protein [Clostridia bacterium]
VTNPVTGVSDDTYIQKTGDVVYDENTKSIKFNEDEVNNPDGEGGYLKLMKKGVDFSEGFTFELYANLSRWTYHPSAYPEVTYPGIGYFCRMPSLDSSYYLAMRFGYTLDSNGKYILCKFNNSSSFKGTGENFQTYGSGEVYAITKDPGYHMGEDFYLTIVYKVYDETRSEEYINENYDTKMVEEGIDKIEFYVNGSLLGYTYYGKNGYANGLKTWNEDDCPFFVGVCPFWRDGKLYYFKGNCYTTRLYTNSMTAKQVRDNYDMTLKYRSSF